MRENAVERFCLLLWRVFFFFFSMATLAVLFLFVGEWAGVVWGGLFLFIVPCLCVCVCRAGLCVWAVSWTCSCCACLWSIFSPLLGLVGRLASACAFVRYTEAAVAVAVAADIRFRGNKRTNTLVAKRLVRARVPATALGDSDQRVLILRYAC